MNILYKASSCTLDYLGAATSVGCESFYLTDVHSFLHICDTQQYRLLCHLAYSYSSTWYAGNLLYIFYIVYMMLGAQASKYSFWLRQWLRLSDHSFASW